MHPIFVTSVPSPCPLELATFTHDLVSCCRPTFRTLAVRVSGCFDVSTLAAGRPQGQQRHRRENLPVHPRKARDPLGVAVRRAEPHAQPAHHPLGPRHAEPRPTGARLPCPAASRLQRRRQRRHGPVPGRVRRPARHPRRERRLGSPSAEVLPEAFFRPLVDVELNVWLFLALFFVIS